MHKLVEEVLKQYNELEETLKRPERNDLGNAQELVRFFKSDLETSGLAFPPLPDYLYQLIMKPDKK